MVTIILKHHPGPQTRRILYDECYRASAPNNNNTRKAIWFSILRRVIAARYGSEGSVPQYPILRESAKRAGFGMGGSRCVPTAMVAITKNQGPGLIQSVVDLHSSA